MLAARFASPMRWAVACKQFFGFKAGQTTSDFMAELRALTPEDKADLKAMFPSVGVEIVELGLEGIDLGLL